MSQALFKKVCFCFCPACHFVLVFFPLYAARFGESFPGMRS